MNVVCYEQVFFERIPVYVLCMLFCDTNHKITPIQQEEKQHRRSQMDFMLIRT